MKYSKGPSKNLFKSIQRTVTLALPWSRGTCSKRFFTFIFVGFFSFNCLPNLHAANDEINPQLVRQTIENAIIAIKKKQNKQGRWPDYPGNVDGPTALCTLALLNAGVPTTDPAVEKALTYLRSADFNVRSKTPKTYTVALDVMVFATADPKRDLLRIKRGVQWLEQVQIKAGPFRGAWGYGANGQGDNSNAQFAVLALHEAERAGVEVSPETWKMAYDYWIRAQNKDGSWGYGAGSTPRGSMTCAGIASLIMASSHVNDGDARATGKRIQCCLPRNNDNPIDRALDWLGRNFAVRRNPGGNPRSDFYYLYALERAGRLTGQRLIGGRDWYREGSDFLILHRKPAFDGSWTGAGLAENQKHIATSFALLFLSKGRRPVVVSKVQHGQGDDWNHHRADVAHLTAYTEKAWDMNLTWQVYNLKTASVEDLLQSPVLFFSGSDSTNFAGQQKKLRDYIDRGGFIFAETTCADGRKFGTDFRQLMKDVFPEKEYKLRQIEPEHPIWRAEKLIRPQSDYIGKLWAVEYGCRTCAVFSEKDLSCYWELHHQGRKNMYAKSVQDQIDDALHVGINVLTYATNREPRGKEENFQRSFEAIDLKANGNRSVLQVAKLKHGGGCNDAPGALANLVRAASGGELRMKIAEEEQLIGATEKNLRNYHLLFMHGRHTFRFTENERKALKQYLERGGTLLVDSICASDAFTKSLRNEMQAIFPDQRLTNIPAEDKMFTKEFGGFNIQKVTRRDPVRTTPGQPINAKTRSVAPELEGIKIDGRWAVIFSPFDISCALEKRDSLQCKGYTRKDAARIGLNVIMYLLNQ